MTLKLTKEKVLDAMEEVIELDAKLVNAFKGLRMNKDAKYRTTEFLIFRQFHSYRRLLTLVDDQLAIDRSSVNQMALLYLLQRFDDFFWRFIPRMEIHFLKKWDSHIAKKHMSKHESEIHLSERMVHGHRLYLMHKRMESETLLSRQKIFREEVQKNEELTRGLDMAKLEEELKEVNIIEFEEAVMIIQCAERMYQAIARYVYLTDVRKKAMDLHNETKTFDTEQAVIKIQARTRGYLARKMVRQMREAENQALGMNVESLLKAKIQHRQRPQPEALKWEPLSIPPSEMKLAPSMTVLLETLRSNLFMTDPLSLEDKPPGECFKHFEQEVENILNRLMSAGICKISSDPDTLPLDDLISYSAVVRVRKEQLHFDLRNFLYVSVVIPHVLSAWPVARIRRNTLLLVGEAGSGKSTWAAAVAQKCASPRIVVSKKQFMRKFMGRKRIYSSIAQFVEGDKYATVVFEQMEIFSAKRSDKKSALKELIRDLLIQEVQDGHCQVIGLSKTEELEQSILDLFNISMHIKRPNMIERYELIADNLSRRMEEDRLQRVPRRLLEISKTTKTMNCGQTVKKINQKFARR